MYNYYGTCKKKLKKYFNYDNFFPFQLKVIENILKNNDIFVFAKTSGGKSICFQIPALITKGITIIISPLRSLIEDQISNLRDKNIPFLTYYGDMDNKTKCEMMEILENLEVNKKYHILYTTHETLE